MVNNYGKYLDVHPTLSSIDISPNKRSSYYQLKEWYEQKYGEKQQHCEYII